MIGLLKSTWRKAYRIFCIFPFLTGCSMLAFGLILGFLLALYFDNQIIFIPLKSIGDFASWLGPSLTSLWALILFAICVATAFVLWRGFADHIRRALGKVTMTVGGISFEIEDGPTRDSIIELHKNARDTLSDQYIIQIDKSSLEIRYHNLMKTVERLFLKKYGVAFYESKFRHCLYVPSYTDGDLIQATEYGGTVPHYRKRRGRIFSMRYGIIGKAYRTNRICINAEIGHDAFELTEDWGLTREEAFHQSKDDEKHSLIAIPILDKEEQVSDARTLPSEDALGVVFIHIMDGHLSDPLKSAFPNEKVTDKNLELANELLKQDAYLSLKDELDKFRKSIRFDHKAFGHEGA